MRQTERFNDREEALRAMLDGFQARVWTALPCIVESFDAEKQTCELQPVIQGKKFDREGESEDVDMPLLVDVPVYFLRGGGFSVTVPIKKGDEGLVVFSSRCIDAWWQSGGVQPQFEQRMHDLSDGFFFPGFTSQPEKLDDYSEEAVEVRSDDGERKVAINDDSVKASVKADTHVELKDKEVNMKAGNSTITMTNSAINIDADTVVINGIAFETHKHTGVQAGGGTSGGPTN